MGRASLAARRAGVPDEDIKAFCGEVNNAGSYDEALQTVMRWFRWS
jgi:hypothetical protein